MTLTEAFEGFNGLRVLVVGDVMLDAYVFGRVERISPEAPVPVVVARRRDMRLGGAGNVLLNVQALGATPLLCSVVGNDRDGQTLFSILQEKGLSTDGLVQAPDRLTTVKERIIAGSQQVVRVDTETDAPLTAPLQEALLQRVQQLLPGCQVVIFEDYDKGVLGPEVIAAILGQARRLGIPTVVDPKKRNFLHYHGATLFKPNLKELREGLNLSTDAADPAQLEAAAGQLTERLGVSGTLITLSERGVFVGFQGESHHLPAHIRQIADVSGAGDTVISIAACCLALGLPPRQLAALSNLGGGLVCESVGVVPISKEQLLQEAEANGIL